MLFLDVDVEVRTDLLPTAVYSVSRWTGMYFHLALLAKLSPWPLLRLVVQCVLLKSHNHAFVLFKWAYRCRRIRPHSLTRDSKCLVPCLSITGELTAAAYKGHSNSDRAYSWGISDKSTTPDSTFTYEFSEETSKGNRLPSRTSKIVLNSRGLLLAFISYDITWLILLLVRSAKVVREWSQSPTLITAHLG